MILKKENLINYLLIIDIILYILGAAYLNYFSLIALILSIYLICKFDIQHSIELCALSAPIAGIMKFVTSISLFNFIYLIVVIKILLNNKLKISKYFLVYIMVMIFEGIYSIAIQSFSVSGEIISFVIGMAFLGIVVSSDIQFDLHAIIEKFSISLIISAFLDIFSSYFPGISKYLVAATFKLESGEKLARLSGFIGNPNHYSVALNVSIMCFLVYVISEKKKKRDILFLFALCGIGIYTLSKSFMLAFILSIIVILVFMLNKSPKKWVKLILAGVILAFILTKFVDVNYIYTMIGRLDISGVNDLNTFTTGRVARYEVYIKYILSNMRVLLFGDGLYNTLEFASHNFYLEMIYYIGIVGTMILLILFSKLRLNKYRCGKSNWIYYTPMLIFLFRGMAVNLVTSIIFPIYMIIIYLFVEEGKRILR